MASYAQEDLRVIPAGDWTRDRAPDTDPCAALGQLLASRDIATTELRVLDEDPADGGAARFIVELHPVPGADA